MEIGCLPPDEYRRMLARGEMIKSLTFVREQKRQVISFCRIIMI